MAGNGPLEREVGTEEDPLSPSMLEQLSERPAASVKVLDLPMTICAWVVHATVEDASFPVIVGQHLGAPLRGAVGYLDERLGRDLSRRQFADILPERLGEFDIVRPRDRELRPAVVGVVGLGPPGELTAAVLSRAISRAVRLFAFAGALPLVDDGLAVSCLLVGTGAAESLGIRDSVRSIVDGVLDANRALLACEGAVRPVATIELVELYGDRAEIADAELCKFCQSVPDNAGTPQVSCGVQRIGEGGRPGQTPSEYREGGWRRIVVRRQDATSTASPATPGTANAEGLMTLEYLSMSRRAAADLGVQTVNVRTLEAVESMTSTSRPDSQLPNTLYELLIPADLKRDLADGAHLQLVVNEDTARLPWEMLATAPQTDVGGSTRRTPIPLATQCGILRQLELPELLRRRIARAKGSDVFILGNPPVGPIYPPLPGAAAEAAAVRALFEDRKPSTRADTFTVRGIIYDEAEAVIWDALGEPDQPVAVRVLNALMAHSYRVLHIAAHGARDALTGHYGIVVGPHDVLTAAELSNLPYVPDLVFLNCCHLGRINPEIPANQLAANLAVSFMRIGVRAVVAAGWAVNDHAAEIFAQQLYGWLVDDGADLGSAVLAARRAIGDPAAYGNTYGAYQVYGDPAFRLTPAQVSAAATHAPRTRSALLRKLQTINVACGNAPADPDLIDRRAAELRQLHERLNALHEAGEPSLGAFWAELGACYRQLGDFDSAIVHYRHALQEPHGDARLEDAERLANLLSRRAFQAGTDQATFEDANNEAEHILTSLLGVAPSAERHGLLGGHRRRQALRPGSDQADLDLLQHALAEDAYGAVTNDKFADSGYLVVNYVSLTAIVALARHDTTHLTAARQVHQRFMEYIPPRPPRDFFERIRTTEVALSGAILDYVCAVLSNDDNARHDAQCDLTNVHGKITGGYLREFKQRSTPAERQSAIDALHQWATIAAPHDQPLADELHRLANDLHKAQT